MKDGKKIYFVFPSVHYTIRAEDICVEKNIPYHIVTTPRQFQVECGMSVVLSEEDMDILVQELTNVKIEYKVFTKGK